jgi:predicted transcriptional regulator
LRRHVSSVADLEVLLLLNATPERAWRMQEVSQWLYLTEATASESLERFVAQRLLLREGESRDTYTYRYETDESGADEVAQLAGLYAHWRVRIIEYIYSRPSDSVKSFAHAFKIKGDKQE